MLIGSETLRIIFSMVRRRCDPGQRFRSTGGWRTDYTGDGGISDLYLYDLQSDTYQKLTSGREAELQPAWSPVGRAVRRGDGHARLLTLAFGLDLSEVVAMAAKSWSRNSPAEI